MEQREASKPRFDRSSLPVVAALFFVIFAVLEGVIFYFALQGGLGWLMELNARITASLSSVIGIPVTLNGIQITTSRNILEIDPDCTAIQLMALYSALILAYPIPWKTRGIGLAVGIPAIAVVNIARLLGVVVASVTLSPQAFLFVHDYLFKVAMMLVVFGLWGWWLLYARRNVSQA
ncbi:MAG: archaeosortase/exosortase family protein [Coriobacteriia bacterium]